MSTPPTTEIDTPISAPIGAADRTAPENDLDSIPVVPANSPDLDSSVGIPIDPPPDRDENEPSSNGKPVLAQLILLVSFGLTAICGCVGWNLIQEQTSPTPSSNSVKHGK